MPTPREEIERILVDTYGEGEEAASWEVAFTDEIQVPFSAAVLGIPVEVAGFCLSPSDAMQCQVIRSDKQRWMAVEDLDNEGLPADAQHLLALYRAWQAGDYCSQWHSEHRSQRSCGGLRSGWRRMKKRQQSGRDGNALRDNQLLSRGPSPSKRWFNSHSAVRLLS